MGIVKRLELNDIGEVTGATLLKGKTNEIVKRHISTLIPYLEVFNNSETDTTDNDIDNDDPYSYPRVRRKAAIMSELRTREHLNL